MPSGRLRRAKGIAAVLIGLTGAACAAAPAPTTIPTGPGAAPVAAPATPRAADPTPVPEPSATVDVVVTAEFEPPAALCPAPRGQVDPPGMSVRVGEGDPIAATMGSTMVQTCSTTGMSDVGEMRYPAPLTARAGDELTFAVDRGWKILWLEAFDHPKDRDGVNVNPGSRVPGGSAEVTIPVPARAGNLIVGMTMWVVSDDGRTVAQLSPSTWVRVED